MLRQKRSNEVTGSHIVLVIYSLTVSGAARRVLALAGAFAEQGFRVTLVTVDPGGGLRSAVPEGVRLRVLSPRSAAPEASGRRRKHRVWRALPKLVWLIARLRPRFLMAGANHVHLVCFVARLLCPVHRPKLALRISNSIGRGSVDVGGRSRAMVALRRRAFRSADLLISVSRDVARDAERCLRLSPGCVLTLPNPVVDTEQVERLASRDVGHPWFVAGEPLVVLGVGRLHPQKDFGCLIQAVATLSRTRPVRLILLGEGPERARLVQMAQACGIADSVDLPGQVANPFAYMRAADVTVLSSRWEGMPGVLAEAMACGCPVVSTDCPGGSREMLDDGRLGPLVTVGDADALAAGIRQALDRPPSTDALQQQAKAYMIHEAAIAYSKALKTLI